MRIVILHQEVGAEARADETDVLEQAAAVRVALQQLGHQHETLMTNGNLRTCAFDLRALRPDIVFNLVESLNGDGERIDLVPAMLERLRLPFTGSGSSAMRQSNDKLATKTVLAANGLPAKAFLTAAQINAGAVPPGRYILKSVFEHGSLGIDDDSVVDVREPADLQRVLTRRAGWLGSAAFAERFIDGREFNLAMLAGEHDVEHLPPAEICFGEALSDRPHIVGYDAKWKSGSIEDRNTARSFDVPSADAPLVARMQDLALRTWSAFGLRGYARVDLRVDPQGDPWIIDINTNPCLSPDAGFVAAVRQARIPFSHAVGRILAAAHR